MGQERVVDGAGSGVTGFIGGDGEGRIYKDAGKGID